MTNKGQISGSAAQIYEDFFVPALFAEPAAMLTELTEIRSGQSVLDVACGTGVFSRAALARVGPAGHVDGVDINEGMLAVASARAPGVRWRLCRAEALPYGEGEFDAVICQFGLMFFEDRRAALAEMRRVARSQGVCAVAVWDALERSPGYAALAGLLHKLFGAEAADALRAPFVLGNRTEVQRLCASAQWRNVEIRTLNVTARFASLHDWLHTEIRGWTLAEKVDNDQFEALLAASHDALRAFVSDDGKVTFPAPAIAALARNE